MNTSGHWQTSSIHDSMNIPKNRIYFLNAQIADQGLNCCPSLHGFHILCMQVYCVSKTVQKLVRIFSNHIECNSNHKIVFALSFTQVKCI